MVDNPHHISNMPKGRSKELIEQRNKKLYQRYRYLLDVRRMRYSAVFEILEQEFFIAEGTILHILRSIINGKDTPSEAPKREFTGFRGSRKRAVCELTEDLQPTLFEG